MTEPKETHLRVLMLATPHLCEATVDVPALKPGVYQITVESTDE